MNKHSKNILLFQRIIPQYRVDLFNELYKRFNIIVCHSKEKHKSKPVDVGSGIGFPNAYLKRIYLFGNDKLVLQNVLGPILKYRPSTIIVEASTLYLSFWLLLLLRTIYKYKLIAWSHGISNKDIKKDVLSAKSKMMIWAYKRLNGIIVYSKGRKELLSKYINDTNKIFIAPNTLNTHKYKRIYEICNQQDKECIKRELNIKGRLNLIFIGRLTKEKKLDLLLDAFDLFSRDYMNIELHIIGDGPEKDKVQEFIKINNNIKYYGEIFDEITLGKLLYCSDIFINPGVIGLAVIHSFSFGIPIITCAFKKNGPFHGPEYEYIINNYNGLVVESSAVAINRAIGYLLNDDISLSKMKVNAFNTAHEDCSLVKMIDGFDKIIYTLK